MVLVLGIGIVNSILKVLVLGIGIVNSLLKVLGEVLGQLQAVLLSKVLGIGIGYWVFCRYWYWVLVLLRDIQRYWYWYWVLLRAFLRYWVLVLGSNFWYCPSLVWGWDHVHSTSKRRQERSRSPKN